MSEKRRLFIAVELPLAIKQELARVGRLLAEQIPSQSIRWLQPDKMHLTLRFLGDTAVSQIPVISQSLAEAAKKQVPFTLQLKQLGCFPNNKKPRVVWVGLQGDETALHTLKNNVDACLVPHGWPLEHKNFKAHLTLGRVKDGRQLTSMNWDIHVEPHSFLVTAVALIESELTPQGPIYSIRQQVKL